MAREKLEGIHPSQGPRHGITSYAPVLLERVDVQGIEVEVEIVLLCWGAVKLLRVTDELLEGECSLEGDFKKAKSLSWIPDVKNNCPSVVYKYDHLVTKPKLEEEDNFQDYKNPTTMATTAVIADAVLITLKEHDIIQLGRHGSLSRGQTVHGLREGITSHYHSRWQVQDMVDSRVNWRITSCIQHESKKQKTARHVTALWEQGDRYLDLV